MPRLSLLLVPALVLAGCSTTETPPKPTLVDPTVYADFRVVPRAPDVAYYPPVAEHVWARAPMDRTFVTVKVTNYPAPQKSSPASRIAITPPVAPAPASPKVSTQPVPTPTLRAEVHFAFDRADLSADARQQLDAFLAQFPSGSDFDVLVDGHTDSVGSTAYNLKLSERRALSVRSYLSSKGIPSSRIAVHASGEAEPAQPNNTSDGRAANRRATVQSGGK